MLGPCDFMGEGALTGQRLRIGTATAVVDSEISQEVLAEMVGTTRSRVNMNKFRKLGFIEYNGGLRVHSSLLNVVLSD
jgi:hypothetical protein